MSRRKRTLKQAFLVTVAAAATAASAGCNGDGNFFDDDGEVITNPPPPPCDNCQDECPAAQPQQGDVCFNVGTSCNYGTDPCDESWAECTAEGWQVYYGTCNPPPPECPAEEPELGTLCEYQPDSWGGYADWCSYPVQTPCGEASQILGCMPDEMTGEMVWTMQQEPESCELPASECHLYDDSSGCAADSACQWLVPGCTDGPNSIVEGCYPVDDCASTGCGDWGECITGVHHPCIGSACTACAAEINVCVPNAVDSP
jgi:hypothetical protein